jgi:hypothetical protein
MLHPASSEWGSAASGVVVRNQFGIPVPFGERWTARCTQGAKIVGARCDEWLLTNTHTILKYFRLFAYLLDVANRRPRCSRHHSAKVLPILRHQ